MPRSSLHFHGFLALIVCLCISGCGEFDELNGAEAEQQMQNTLAHLGIGSAKFVAAARDEVFTGSSDFYYKFTIDPKDVAGTQASVRASWCGSSSEHTVFARTSFSRNGRSKTPSWWKPESLSNADTLSLDPYPGFWLAISRDSGDAYLFCSGH
jgi:hypothetical protein